MGKGCTLCGIYYYDSKANFYKHMRTSDGLQSHCKECVRKRKRDEYAYKHPVRKRTKYNPPLDYEIQLKYDKAVYNMTKNLNWKQPLGHWIDSRN